MASALDTNQADVKQNPGEIQDLTASVKKSIIALT